MRRWPPASRQAMQSSICARLPTMIVLIWLARSVSWTARVRLIGLTLPENPEPETAMKTAFYSHSECRGHDMGRGHPECPERLDAICDHLIASGLDAALDHRDAPLAELSDLALAHSSGFVAELRDVLHRVADSGDARAIDPDTIAAPGT